tara:strand:+ start:248 stop:799 length:552 start_codon:yes stop_codon:yes gene_type:complete
MSELNFTHPNGNKVKLTTPDALTGNRTIKLPDNENNGQVITTARAGTILQTVYNSTATEGQTQSSSFQNWSGLATNFTPISSTSHLWIWINAIRINVQQDSNEGRLRVTDGTNNTEIYRCANYDSDGNYLSFNPCLNWYWPQTHTAGTQITLTPQLRSINGSGYVVWGDNGDESYMIIQEIAR